MESDQTSFLQQKQQYLREHIDSSQYEDFYEFCQNDVGNVDVNSWTMPYVQQIVLKYKEYKKALRNAEQANQHERTYNEYQSVDPDTAIQIKNNLDQDDCRSSRVMKSSAVDLLDEAFQTTSVADSNKSNNYRTNSVGFQDFDFWTSGYINTNNTPKNSQSTRQKSFTHHNDMTKTQNFDSMYQHNNSKQYNDWNKTQSFQPMYKPNNKYSNQFRNSSPQNYQTQQQQSNNYLGGGMDVFMVPPKKQSPYMKKQTPIQTYDAGNDNFQKEKKIKIEEITHYRNKSTMNTNNNLKQQDSYNSVKNIQNESQKVEKNIVKGKWILQDKIFHEKITCFKSTQRNQLNHPNLNIAIDDKYDIIQRSFLAADYPMYKLKVSPLGTQCKRNYDDFSKLKQNLQKFFPGMHLAYLEDGSWFSGTDPQFIEKQKKMIEMFMRDLLRNKEVRNSRVMEDFLTLQQHKTIKRKFQKYETMADLKGIQELCLLDGSVEVTISSQQSNYINNMQHFIHKMDDYYSKHRKLTESLSKQFSNLMQTYNTLIRLMGNIEKQIKNFNTKVTTNQIKHLGRVYKILKQTYREDLSSLKFQYEITQKKITPFLKYQQQNMLQLNKLMEIEKKMHKVYNKRSLTEKVQYDDGYNSEKARHGKKNITQQSRNIVVLKYQLGFYGHRCRLESQRVFDQMGYKILSKWQNIAQSYLDRFTKNIEYRKNLVKIQKQQYLPKQIQVQ